MRKVLNVLFAVGLASAVSGCAFVGSAMGGNSTETGEAWWTRNVGLNAYLLFSSKVYYCPQPGNNAPAQCKEAKMVEGPGK